MMKNLAAAMVKAQKDMENPSFDAQNPHFRSKYASLVAVVEAVIPVLNKHGLAVQQWPICKSEGERLFAGCRTVLMHESGEVMDSECLLPLDKANAHGAGSCITYARRYSLMAIAGVVGDEDDDANAAVAKVTPTAGAGDDLTRQQKERVEALAGKIVDFFHADQPTQAFNTYEQASEWDTDDKVYLWTFLDSKQRATIKRMGAQKREREAELHPATQA